MPLLSEIQIRDPFVLPYKGHYYLYGSTDKDIWRGPASGFDCYKSRGGGLDEWDGPFPAFRPPEGFWSDSNFWAPEVYQYRGADSLEAWYMFATFKPRPGCRDGGRRGTAVLKSSAVDGPFQPWSEGPLTPQAWECLDGTLYVEEGQPYMVFCHEWKQTGNGEIHAMPLSADLKSAAGEPRLLFKAAEAPWAQPLQGRPPGSYVTDGPNLYRSGVEGPLFMLWSSFGRGGYTLGVARSETGLVLGPWVQDSQPLFSGDGGHGMLFRAFDGRLLLAVHTPNKTPNERAVFVEIEERNGWLRKKNAQIEQLGAKNE